MATARKLSSAVTAVAAAAILSAASCTPDEPREASPEADEREPIAEDAALDCGNIGEQIVRARRGWVPGRAHDIALIPREPNYIGSAARPVHTGPWDFLADVPLFFYGPGVITPGTSNEDVTLADLAPTIADLIGFDGFDSPDGRSLAAGMATGRRPRLVLTIVWDGAGWNALGDHDSSWPYLHGLLDEGMLFERAEIGSTPSNTPPIHTTIGTGAFPRRHGIPSVKMRTGAGDFVDPYEGPSAGRVKLPTLADVYDAALDNEPEIAVVATVNWHLGMIGKGASHPGGDRDIALLMNDQGAPWGNADDYLIPAPAGASLEEATGELDAADGARDGAWGDRDLSDTGLRYASPAYVTYQGDVLTNLIESERLGGDAVTDLVFTNFKSPDDAGHRWGMSSPEVAAAFEAADEALRKIVATLDRVVGPKRWAIALTADHGQTPYPSDSGGWPIGGGELRRDANAALDRADDGKDIVTQVTSAGAFVDRSQLEANDTTMAEVARWLAGYRVGENVVEGDRLPEAWRDRADEPLFDGAVIGDGRAIVTCAR